jgi:hypothetical protein
MLRQQTTLLMAIFYGLAALVLLVIAAFVWLGTIQRWGAASALASMDQRFLARDYGGARSAAQSASGWLGSDARSVLPGLKRSDADRLSALRRSSPANQRQTISDAETFLNLQRGSGEFVETSTANGTLLSFVNLIRKGQGPLPKWPTIDRGVDWNIQIFALEETLIAAAKVGDSLAFRTAAERLLIAEPRHPCRPQLELISAFMDSSIPLGQALNAVKDEEQRFATLRFLVHLLQFDPAGMEGNTDAVAARVEEAAKGVPFNKRTETEQALAVYFGDQSPKVLAGMAQKTNSTTIQTMVAIRLLQSGAIEEVKQLAAQLPPAVGHALLRTVAIREFDKEALVALGGELSDLPQVTNFRFGFDHVSFFLVNAEGIAPSVPVEVFVDGVRVGGDGVEQFGSLFTVQIRQGKPHVRLAIHVHGEELFSEVYQR